MLEPNSIFLLISTVTMLLVTNIFQILAANREAQSPVRTAVQLKATLKGHSKSIIAIAFSPNGEIVATGSEDGAVRLWSVHTGEPQATIVGADKYFWMELKWSPDGQKLAICGTRRRGESVETQVWDTRTGASQPILIRRFSKVYLIEWSPDGRTLLTIGEKSKVMLWDAESGNLKVTLEPESPSYKTENAYFVAGGQRVLITSKAQPSKLWDAATGKLITTLLPNEEIPSKNYPSPAVPFFSPDRRLLVSSNVRLLDGATGQLISTLKDVGNPLAFSPDGNMLLTVKYDPQEKISHRQSYLTLWEVAKGRSRVNFRVPEGIRDVYWSPDGKTIVILGFDFNTRLVDTYIGYEKARLPYGTCLPDQLFGSDGCEPFTFSLDGQVLMKLKEPIKLWSANNGELIAVIESARLPAIFSPTDKRMLVTRGKDKKTALLWSVV